MIAESCDSLLLFFIPSKGNAKVEGGSSGGEPTWVDDVQGRSGWPNHGAELWDRVSFKLFFLVWLVCMWTL